MKFARWVFAVAGIYGLLVMTPFYWLEEHIGRDDPPPLTHPEYFYGFVGIALAWQVAFLVIAIDPVRHRWLMFPAVLEKAAFAIAVPMLFMQGRTGATVLAFSLVDAALGVLFVISFIQSFRQSK